GAAALPPTAAPFTGRYAILWLVGGPKRQARVSTMRHLTIILSAAAMAASCLAIAGEAYAQSRVRTITVTPRSYLDPGKVVPVGSMSNYVLSGQSYSSPVYANVQERFGSTVLPPRIGGGRNPFGPIDFQAPR